MKSILTLSAVFLISITATAQLERGMRYFGNSSLNSSGINFNLPESVVQGELGNLSYVSQEEDDLGLFFVAPQYGAFLSNNLLLGGGLGFVTITDFDESNSILLLNPFARFYANPNAAKTHFFGQVGLNYAALLGEDGEDNFGLDAGIGITHFLAPGLGLDTYFQYNIQDLSERGTATFGLITTLNIYLGNEQRQNRRTAVSGAGRGSLMIGGTGGSLRIQDNELGKSTGLNLNPKVLYFIKDRFALGAGLALAYARRESFSKVTQTSIAIRPQMRYYFSQGRHQQWFIGAGAEAGWDNLDVEGFFSSNSNFFGFGLGAGMNVFLTPGLAFEFGPSLLYRAYSNDSSSPSALTLGISAGLQFFINKKKE